MSKINHLTKETYKDVLKEGVSFVAFWAPWCGPCRMMAPVYEQVADELNDVKICKVNSDDEQEIAVEFGVRSIPTMFFLKDGKVVEQLVGANPKQKIIDTINKYK